MIAKMIGTVEHGRGYEKSSPMIEWTCTSGKCVDGSAKRTGFDRSTGLAIYKLNSFRFPETNNTAVVVDHDGTLLEVGTLKPFSV